MQERDSNRGLRGYEPFKETNSSTPRCVVRAGEKIRTSEAFAADYKSAPFDLFGTPAFDYG